MPRRREIKGIGACLLRSFISRNNDVDGYWGIGKLYRHALSNGVAGVDIDLLKNSLVPFAHEYRTMVAGYSDAFFNLCMRVGIPPAWIVRAGIHITFNVKPGSELWLRIPHTGEDFFECRFEAQDDRGRCHTVRVFGLCWPHDPAREHRSGRAR